MFQHVYYASVDASAGHLKIETEKHKFKKLQDSEIITLNGVLKDDVNVVTNYYATVCCVLRYS